MAAPFLLGFASAFDGPMDWPDIAPIWPDDSIDYGPDDANVDPMH